MHKTPGTPVKLIAHQLQLGPIAPDNRLIVSQALLNSIWARGLAGYDVAFTRQRSGVRISPGPSGFSESLHGGFSNSMILCSSADSRVSTSELLLGCTTTLPSKSSFKEIMNKGFRNPPNKVNTHHFLNKRGFRSINFLSAFLNRLT